MKFGTDNRELTQILYFQDVAIETLTFTGAEIIGKYFQLFSKEYKNGKLVKTDTLFDGGETDYFKIKSDTTSFKFMSQTSDNKLKIQIKETKFASKKSIFKTYPTNREYVLKDFLGIEKEIEVPIGKPFYIFAIITPTINKDGSGSYCKVAQSDIPPETFGTKFKISHYFLIQMIFK